MIFAVVTFIAILAVVLGAYWAFVLRVDQSEDAVLKKRLQPDPAVTDIPKKFRLLKPTERLSHVARLETILGKMDWLTSNLRRDLTQAGLSMTVGRVLLSSGFLALVAYTLVRFVFFNTLLAIAAGLVTSFAPFIYVKMKKTQRLRKFEEQFPEAIDLMGRSLRAGHAFTTGLALAAEEIPAPVGEEFKLLYDRQNYGMPLPQAMRAFAERIPLVDARFFVTAVLTQRETGGNLGEILDNLASVIRERFKVKRQVRVLTAHGRTTGWILSGLPPVLALAMFIISPGHIAVMTGDPLGVQMIVGALVLQVIGTLTIRKLVDIRY